MPTTAHSEACLPWLDAVWLRETACGMLACPPKKVLVLNDQDVAKPHTLATLTSQAQDPVHWVLTQPAPPAGRSQKSNKPWDPLTAQQKQIFFGVSNGRRTQRLRAPSAKETKSDCL